MSWCKAELRLGTVNCRVADRIAKLQWWYFSLCTELIIAWDAGALADMDVHVDVDMDVKLLVVGLIHTCLGFGWGCAVRSWRSGGPNPEVT